MIRFGILGPGKIAHRFADAFQYVPEAKIVAVASRDANKAREFSDKYRIERSYSGYEELVADPNVDIIYIATPHPFHYGQTLMCLKKCKPVLCEKPLAVNFRHAKEMVDAARESKTFMMEAMWSRFFPTTETTLKLLASGVIGDVKFLNADFGFAGPVNLESRLYNMKLAGGAQLDVGVYPLFLALLVLGKPESVKAFSHLATTGADTTTSALLNYKSGAIAHIFSSIVTDSVKDAHIMGTLGRITIETPWHKSQKVSVRLNSGAVTDYKFPHSGNGFEFQIQEVVRCLGEKKTESDRMPHSLSLMMAEVADEIRKQGGVRYSEDL
jgi:predicted dehydrogenase